jgi:GntR family transcriptional regulator
MEIQVDFRSGQPIYLQIVEQVQEQIHNGQLRPGIQLPTVRQLAADLRVNFNTVARAYRLLDEAGLISTQLGRGTYVWETPSDESLRLLHQRSLEQQVLEFIQGLQKNGYSKADINIVFNQIMKGDLSKSHEES